MGAPTILESHVGRGLERGFGGPGGGFSTQDPMSLFLRGGDGNYRKLGLAVDKPRYKKSSTINTE